MVHIAHVTHIDHASDEAANRSPAPARCRHAGPWRHAGRLEAPRIG